MSSIKISVELPEGIELDTREYETSHGAPSNEYGSWAFEPVEFSDPAAAVEATVDLDENGWLWLKGTLTDVIENELPEGEWRLLP